MLLLGNGNPDDLNMEDRSLGAGIGKMKILQGVTLIRTSLSMAATFLSGVPTDPEAKICRLLTSNLALFLN